MSPISIPCVETILAIETSVPEASVALWCDGEWLYEQDFTSDRHHNSMVFEPIEEALRVLDGRQLSTVIVGTGPGSYSGIRIGIAVAQGVAIARACPTVGVGSLAATPVACLTREAGSGKRSMAVGDARRGLYFVAPISERGEAMDAELMDAEAFAARLRDVPDHALFTLDDPAKLGLESDLVDRLQVTRPEAKRLIDVWLGLDPARQEVLTQQPLSPSYLRAPFTSKAKPGHPLLRKG